MDSKKCLRTYQRRKKCLKNEEDIDRISDLHDSILGKILSFLPIKDMIATSILSTRWKNLFPNSVPFTHLVLDDSSSSYHKFVCFVYKLLNVHLRDVACVESVAISCRNYYGEDKILSWVRAALRLNPKRLRLLSYGLTESFLFILNGCTTLEELELGDSDYESWLPEGFILPNLKRLVLNSASLVVMLKNGCPVLTDLRINASYLGYLDTLHIRHPFIKKLFVDCSSGGDMNKVVIDAPNLESFEFKGHFVAEYDFMNIKSLHSVCIYLSGDHRRFSGSLNLAKLVHACSSATRLLLPGNSVDDMCLFSCVTLPRFPNLTCLALGRMGSEGWSVLAQFLTNAPNLTKLTFEEDLDFIYYAALAKVPRPLSSLPCLELHVKKIEIWEFKWIPDEIKLIKYFLKNGRLLEELIVHCLPCENKSDLEKLTMFRRRSKVCQVLFKDKVSRRKPCHFRESWFQA